MTIEDDMNVKKLRACEGKGYYAILDEADDVVFVGDYTEACAVFEGLDRKHGMYTLWFAPEALAYLLEYYSDDYV